MTNEQRTTYREKYEAWDGYEDGYGPLASTYTTSWALEEMLAGWFFPEPFTSEELDRLRSILEAEGLIWFDEKIQKFVHFHGNSMYDIDHLKLQLLTQAVESC